MQHCEPATLPAHMRAHNYGRLTGDVSLPPHAIPPYTVKFDLQRRFICGLGLGNLETLTSACTCIVIKCFSPLPGLGTGTDLSLDIRTGHEERAVSNRENIAGWNALKTLLRGRGPPPQE